MSNDNKGHLKLAACEPTNSNKKTYIAVKDLMIKRMSKFGPIWQVKITLFQMQRISLEFHCILHL